MWECEWEWTADRMEGGRKHQIVEGLECEKLGFHSAGSRKLVN